MNRIYSLILLFSFMVGALQPVTPMLEYALSESGKTEVFDFFQTEGKDHCSITADQNKSNDCDCCGQPGEELLDVDYYPVPVNIIPETIVGGLLAGGELYSSGKRQTITLYYRILSPPPRLV